MRKRFATLALAIALVLPLGGCAAIDSVFGGKLSLLAAEIQNPIGQNDIYRAKNAYAAALQLDVEYRTYCWARPYAVLMADPVSAPVCQYRRTVVRKVQSARPKVAAAIQTAENFARDNPTITVSTAITAMWTAVDDFKKLIPGI